MSRHHVRWRNGAGAKARARLARTLPAPCCRCGKPVTADMAWEADHIVALDQWPESKPYPDSLVRVAHKSCNRAHGGRIGAAKTNAKKKAGKKGAMPW